MCMHIYIYMYVYMQHTYVYMHTIVTKRRIIAKYKIIAKSKQTWNQNLHNQFSLNLLYREAPAHFPASVSLLCVGGVPICWHLWIHSTRLSRRFDSMGPKFEKEIPRLLGKSGIEEFDTHLQDWWKAFHGSQNHHTRFRIDVCQKGTCSNLLQVNVHDLQRQPSSSPAYQFWRFRQTNQKSCTSRSEGGKCQRLLRVDRLSWKAKLGKNLVQARPQSWRWTRPDRFIGLEVTKPNPSNCDQVWRL